ncbi:hypothetical protein [Actinoplanes utahensis]|uniref:hypothetical protein n=1 Tax=Actinoplanes utahensis TaxID=1869 RepID=UPI001951BE58|nr:hypothetical protein [Actinoplanes utahensis]GIF34077.1 hypothetical protein Aut01nite_70630 [Actinoplanes utahensis]
MTRPQQRPATWLLRWLLIVSVLAGVGLVQVTHCAAPTVGHHTATAPLADDGHRHAHPHASTTGDVSAGTAAGECHVSAPAADPAVLAGTVTIAVTTTSSDCPPVRARTLTPLRAPTVTLTQLGISRI